MKLPLMILSPLTGADIVYGQFKISHYLLNETIKNSDEIGFFVEF